MELIEKYRVYQSVQGYTLNALRKAIKELEKSIKDPQNKSVVEHLEVRKNELENALEKIENFE